MNENKMNVWFMTGLQNWLPQKHKKKIITTQQGSDHENMMKETRRQPSTGQKRKMNTWQIRIIFPQINQCGAQIFMHV